MATRTSYVTKAQSNFTFKSASPKLPNRTLPPAYLYSVIFLLVSLLTIPTLIVGSWLLEQTFYFTTSFGWEAFGELAFPLGACIFAASVFLCRNPMHALLSLLGVFFATVLMYLTAGIVFVGLVFLIVYVGAVAVLFLFVIMLLNVKSLTSADQLIQHASQIAAIAGTAALIAYLHTNVISALDRSLSDGFLRDAMVESTTGEAVLFYVRFQAMDINALTGLYTLHAVLFLVITSILLAALLGAIILATVTTERATSISDIRTYSVKKLPSTAVMLSAVAVFAILPEAEFAVVVRAVTADLAPVFFSLPAFRLDDNWELENKRQCYFRREGQRHARVDTQYPMFDRRLACKRLRVSAVQRKARTHTLRVHRRLGVVKENHKLRALLLRKGSVLSSRRLLARPRVFRLYTASALAAVMFKLLRRRSDATIVRSRWLWHWRRDRARWLHRVGQKPLSIRPGLLRRVRRLFRTRVLGRKRTWKGYPCYPTTSVLDAKGKTKQSERVRFDVYGKVIFALPKISFRWAPVKYLRFYFRTRVLPVIQYWAWRIRAFCALFLFYLFVVPLPTIAAYWLVEEYTTTWADLVAVYHGLRRELPYLLITAPDSMLTKTVAGALIFPAAVFVWTAKNGVFVVLLAALFAYDTVLMHGGELSDLEFHESRCDYWRKRSRELHEHMRAVAAAEALERSRRHPDKGRTDAGPYLFKLLESIYPPWLWKIVGPILNYLYSVYLMLENAVHDLQTSQAYRCLSAYARSLWPSFLEKYPFIMTWYRSARQAVVSIAEYSWSAWCQEVWPAITAGFEIIAYCPEWLRLLVRIDRTGGTALVVSVLLAGVLYSLACLMLRLRWQQMYQGLHIRRPSIFLPVLLFFFCVYAGAVFYPMSQYLHAVFRPDMSLRPWAYAGVNDENFYEFLHPWLKLAVMNFLLLKAVVWLFDLYDDELGALFTDPDRTDTEIARPLTLRAYFNVWVRRMRRFAESERRMLADELLPFSSNVEALADAEIETKKYLHTVYRAEQAKLLHFNIVMHTYIPTYDDRHPRKQFATYHLAGVYLSDKHHNNPFHSG